MAVHEEKGKLIIIMVHRDSLKIPSQYCKLENNPKQIRTLIGLKPCFYNSIETQN